MMTSRGWRIAGVVVATALVVILLWLWPEIFLGVFAGILVLALLLAGTAFFWREKKKGSRERSSSSTKEVVTTRRSRRVPWGVVAKVVGVILLAIVVAWAIMKWWPDGKATASVTVTATSSSQPKPEKSCSTITPRWSETVRLKKSEESETFYYTGGWWTCWDVMEGEVKTLVNDVPRGNESPTQDLPTTQFETVRKVQFLALEDSVVVIWKGV